jgi:hypothetical protein
MRPRPEGTSSVARVLDQTQADVFFVPFMGSQAFLCADSAQYTLPDHEEVCGELRGKNHELAVRPHPSPDCIRSACLEKSKRATVGVPEECTDLGIAQG